MIKWLGKFFGIRRNTQEKLNITPKTDTPEPGASNQVVAPGSEDVSMRDAVRSLNEMNRGQSRERDIKDFEDQLRRGN